jgi:hypothetical protein
LQKLNSIIFRFLIPNWTINVEWTNAKLIYVFRKCCFQGADSYQTHSHSIHFGSHLMYRIFFQSDKNVRKKIHLRLEVQYGFQYHDLHKTHNAQKSNFTHIGQKNLASTDRNLFKPCSNVWMFLRLFSVIKACSTTFCKDYNDFNENKTKGSFGDPMSQTDRRKNVVSR